MLQIKAESDGTPEGTRLFDTKTGESLLCSELRIRITPDEAVIEAVIYVNNVKVTMTNVMVEKESEDE